MKLHTKKSNLAHKGFEIDVKSVDAEHGKFSGYGSVFGNVDSHREIVKKGAFKKSLEKKTKYPLLWSHDTYTPPIGVVMAKEDDHGLFVEGELNLSDELAQRVHWSMKHQTLNELSIGYYPTVFTPRDEKTGVRELVEVDLVEVSTVLVASNDEARIDAVKEVLASGNMPSMKQFEQFLREAGWSRTQAKAIASHGYAYLYRGESGREDEGEEARKMMEMLSSFKFN